MSAPPVVSVVVPVYNTAKFLPECLASVAASVDALPSADRALVEVVVCDNWSTDGSAEIAADAAFDCRHVIVRPDQHEPNRTRNWSVGIERASGAWKMMLHADDRMAVGALRALLGAVRSNGARGASLIVGRHRVFETDGPQSELRPRWALPSLMNGTDLAREVLPFHCPFVPFILFRATDYAAVGGLDDSWELVQDWELWMRLACRGDVLFVPAEVGSWRLHGNSLAYRRVNAEEHVRLARSLDASVPGVPSRRQRSAVGVALARAENHLRGTEEAGSDGRSWLRGLALPSAAVGDARMRSTRRRVAVNQLLLRAIGVTRLLRSGGR